MRTLVILLALTVLVVGIAGCTANGQRSISRNAAYCHDDLQRAFGLDMPSQLHTRDNVALDVYEPYRGY